MHQAALLTFLNYKWQKYSKKEGSYDILKACMILIVTSVYHKVLKVHNMCWLWYYRWHTLLSCVGAFVALLWLCNGNTCQSSSFADLLKFKQLAGWPMVVWGKKKTEKYLKHSSSLNKHAPFIVFAAFHKQPFFCNVYVEFEVREWAHHQ